MVTPTLHRSKEARHGLPKKSIVLVVVANPKPNQIVAVLDCRNSVAGSDSGRPEPAHLLEVEGRMLTIDLHELIALVGERLHCLRKCLV
jgi:hypothetical protein